MSDLAALRLALQKAARPETVPALQKFFKTGVGEYGEGDQFIGVKVPDSRRLAPLGDALAFTEIVKLLRSPIHEERLLALHILVRRYQKKGSREQEAIIDLYLREKRCLNNWDLVDASAPYLLGDWLLTRDRALLDELIASSHLWDRRMAMVSTWAFIRAGDLAWTFRLAEALLEERHDLLHKAAGWMLREAGKREADALRSFLDEHALTMPRTMLRYAIERFTPAERLHYRQRRRR